MRRTRVWVAVSSALISCFMVLTSVGCRPEGFRAQQPEPVVGDTSDDGRFANVDKLVSKGLHERDIPSVSIAVAHKGHVIWEQSWGWADRENQLSASPHTIYSLASTTKPMIATGLMVLEKAGKVDLDAPVERYIGPDLLTMYEGSARDITLRRLLHHTAGLPVHFNYYYADEPSRPPSLVETIRRFGIIVQPPGKEFCYSNLGYALIGHVIAQVSGRPLAEFMTGEVFQPLGMVETLFDPDSSARGGVAVMYDGSGEIAHFERSDAPGAGHGYSNVHELIRFGMFHLKDHLKDQTPILDDTRIDWMQMEKSGAVHPGGGSESYGLGWFFDETTNGLRTVWHEGGWTGASAMLKLVPSNDIAVAVLMNVYDREFVNQVTDETIRALLPAYANQEGQAADRAAVSSPSQFDLPVGRYSGEVHTSSGAIPFVLQKEDGGELYAVLGDPASAPRRVRIAPSAVPRLAGQFLATFPGPIGDQDAARHDHAVWLDLRFANDELYGTASAMTLGGHGWEGIDDQRMRFHLPYHVSLKRTN